MVNNSGLIIHKTDLKKGRRHDYDIYKKNHPVTPKEVVNVYDLEDTLELKSAFQSNFHLTTLQKEEKPTKRVISRRKRVQPKSF